MQPLSKPLDNQKGDFPVPFFFASRTLIRLEISMTLAKPAYKRILLKLSGEALMGEDAFGINRDTIVRMVEEIAEITRLGVEVAVVIGGGNIFRGVAGGSVGMDRATADYMGMLATVMNALAL